MDQMINYQGLLKSAKLPEHTNNVSRINKRVLLVYFYLLMLTNFFKSTETN